MTTVAQLPPEEQTFWLIALGIGVVVVIVVIALLTLLLRLVRYIDDGVADVWQTATKLAANTATTWQFQRLLNTAEHIKQEAMYHDELLGRQ